VAQIPTDERRFKAPKAPTVSYVRPPGPAPAVPKDNFLRGSKASFTPTVQPRPENKGFTAAATTPPKNFWADPTGYGQPLYDNYLSKILPSKERLANSSFSYLNLLDPRNTFEPKMIPGIIGSAVPGGKAFNLLGEAIKESGYGDTISQYGPLAALGVTAAKMFGNRNDPIAMARDLMPLFKSAVTSQVVGGLNDMTGWNWNAAVPAIYPKANLGFVNPQYASPANAGSYSQWLTDPRVTQNSPNLLPAPRKGDYLPGESTSYLNWNAQQWEDYQRREGLIGPSIPLLPKPKLKPGSGNITEFFDKNPFNLELNPWNVINPNLTNPTDFMGKNEEGDFPDMPEETYAEKMQRWLKGSRSPSEQDEYGKFMLGKDYDPEADDTPDWEPPKLPSNWFGDEPAKIVPEDDEPRNPSRVKPKGAGGGWKGFYHGDWGNIKQVMDQFFRNQDPPPSVLDKNTDPDFIKAFEEELFDNPGVNPYIIWDDMMKNWTPVKDRPKMGYTDSDGREWFSSEAKDDFLAAAAKAVQPEPNPLPPPPEIWWPRVKRPTTPDKNAPPPPPYNPDEDVPWGKKEWQDYIDSFYQGFQQRDAQFPESDWYAKPDLTNWFPPGFEPGKGFQFDGMNDYFPNSNKDEDDYFDYFTSIPISYGPNQDQSKDWGPSFDEQIRNPSYDETDPENPYLNYEIQHMETHLRDAEDPISYTDSLGNEWANRREYDDFINSLGRTRQNDRATWEEGKQKAGYDLFRSQKDDWNPKWGPMNNTPYQWMNNNPEPFDAQKMVKHPKSSFGSVETGKPHDYKKDNEWAQAGGLRTISGFEREGDKDLPWMAWARLSVDDKLMVYDALGHGDNNPDSLSTLPQHILDAIETSFTPDGIHNYVRGYILPPISQMDDSFWEQDFRRIHEETRGVYISDKKTFGQVDPEWAETKFKPGRKFP